MNINTPQALAWQEKAGDETGEGGGLWQKRLW